MNWVLLSLAFGFMIGAAASSDEGKTAHTVFGVGAAIFLTLLWIGLKLDDFNKRRGAP